MRPTIRVTGIDAIQRKVRAMGAALTRETLVPIMEEHLQPMADDMRSHARRRSGRMADSVTVSTQLSPHQAAVNEPIADIEVFAGPGPLPEAIQEEFGNYRESPHPFIRPGFDANVRQAMAGIEQDGVDAILSAATKG